MRQPALVFAALLLMALSETGIGRVEAQAQPQRDARRPGTSVISGTVVSDETSPRPLRRARVSARATELGPNGLTVVTDDRGAFALTGLPAARYTLQVEKDGWTSYSYGARRPGRPGTSVVVAEGQQITGLTIRVPRSGIITGSVVDQNGQPAVGASVRAMRYTFMGGGRRLAGAGTGGSVDDRGLYRIHSLPAGEYVVVATLPRGGPFSTTDLSVVSAADVARARAELSAPATSQAVPGVRTAAAQAGRSRVTGVAYAPIYYPGTPVATQATMVTVAAGEERGGVDIQLQLAPTSRIDGVVSLPEGVAPGSVTVSLVMLGEELTAAALFFESSYRTTRVRPDGGFTIFSVKPGQYIVSARGQAPGAKPNPAESFQLGTLWASTEITVDGNDISNLALELQPGLTVSGRLQFETADPQSAPDPSRFRVLLSAAPGQITFGSSPGPVDATGTFTITGVTPGRYSIRSSVPNVPNASKWALKSSVAGGRDTLDFPIDIRPNQHLEGVVITFTDSPAELSGIVTDAAGQPAADHQIILFAADRTFWTANSRRIKSVRPAQDGNYALRPLPAGDYLLAAIVDVEQDEWFDPSFLQRLAPSAMRISIAEGEKRIQDIRIGSGR